jgi:hypothetical protein
VAECPLHRDVRASIARFDERVRRPHRRTLASATDDLNLERRRKKTL